MNKTTIDGKPEPKSGHRLYPGYNENSNGLRVFNLVHMRRASKLFSNGFRWFVEYPDVIGQFHDYGYGADANSIVRRALRTEVIA